MSRNPSLTKRRIRQYHGNYHQQKISLMHVCDKRLLPREKSEWMNASSEGKTMQKIWWRDMRAFYLIQCCHLKLCLQYTHIMNENRNMKLLTIHMLFFRIEKKGKLWNISQQLFWLQMFLTFSNLVYHNNRQQKYLWWHGWNLMFSTVWIVHF